MMFTVQLRNLWHWKWQWAVHILFPCRTLWIGSNTSALLPLLDLWLFLRLALALSRGSLWQSSSARAHDLQPWQWLVVPTGPPISWWECSSPMQRNYVAPMSSSSSLFSWSSSLSSHSSKCQRPRAGLLKTSPGALKDAEVTPPHHLRRAPWWSWTAYNLTKPKIHDTPILQLLTCLKSH